MCARRGGSLSFRHRRGGRWKGKSPDLGGWGDRSKMVTQQHYVSQLCQPADITPANHLGLSIITAQDASDCSPRASTVPPVPGLIFFLFPLLGFVLESIVDSFHNWISKFPFPPRIDSDKPPTLYPPPPDLAARSHSQERGPSPSTPSPPFQAG